MLKLDSFYYNRLLSLDKNDNQSLIWYTKAAESGYPTAMYNIAFYYENGIGSILAYIFIRCFFWSNDRKDIHLIKSTQK